MQYDDLSKRPIEQLVNQVQSLAAVGAQPEVQAIAALAARLTIELSIGLTNVASGMHDAKAQLAQRMDKLAEQIAETRDAMDKASALASQHTVALVRWTMVMGVATVIYAAVTVWAVLSRP